MCFGILRKMESLMVQQKDVLLRANHIDAQLPCPTKIRREELMLKFPHWLLDVLNACIEQLDDERLVDSHFLSNMSEKKGTRTHDMEEHVMGKMAKELARRLGKDPINFTAKSMPRLEAIHLAEAGVSITGL